MLIAAGADVNAKDHIEDSAVISMPARKAATKSCEMTLEAGRRSQEHQPLRRHRADPGRASRPSGDGAILLRTKIDRDHVNKLGWTALLEAVILGDGGPTYTRIVQMLVKAGANPDIADRGGVTPLGHARARNLTAIAKILEAAGAR